MLEKLWTKHYVQGGINSIDPHFKINLVTQAERHIDLLSEDRHVHYSYQHFQLHMIAKYLTKHSSDMLNDYCCTILRDSTVIFQSVIENKAA